MSEPAENQTQTAPEPDIVLDAKNIDRIFNPGRSQLHVLKDVSVSVYAGEVLCIVGASGAGKSTLLHIMGGLDRPTRGRVYFCGEDLYALPPRRLAQIRAEQIGFVFQAYHLLPELDVLENVMLPTMARTGAARESRNACRDRAMELLRAVGLATRAQHMPSELSGGEQQRVALARALVNAPQLVFADEPTGNLDSRTGKHVLDHLFALTERSGHSLVVVTHNFEVASRCARVVRLEDGQIAAEQVGPDAAINRQ